MKTIALCNQKGGVGKTAVAVNLAGALSTTGQRTLFVDVDPQGNGTVAYGIDPETSDDTANLANAILGTWTGDPHQLINKHDSGVHIIPGCAEMFLVDGRLYPTPGRERRLTNILTKVKDDYDIAILDCPPSLSPLTDAALYAASAGVIVPLWAEPASLRALGILLDQLDTLRDAVGAAAPLLGLVLTQVDDAALTKAVLTEVNNIGVPVLAQLRRTTRLRNAANQGKTIQQTEPTSPPAQQFTDLATEVLTRLETTQ